MRRKKGPTPAQRKVLQAMADGWGFGREDTYHGGFWMQQGGLGCGGPSEEVRVSTGFALLQAGWIVVVRKGWPTVHYALTPAGRTALASD